MGPGPRAVCAASTASRMKTSPSIPLWQLVEHFAYHKRLCGVGADAVSLYQNIEQWRPAFRYPAEK